MADRTQFEDALVRAHNSGDAEGAKVIAEEIKTRFPRAPARSMPPAKSDPALAGYSPIKETISDLPRIAKDAFSSAITGVMDLPVGAGQLVSEVAGAVGAEGFRDRYRNYRQQREAQYQGERAYPDNPDTARFGGSLLPAIPFGMVSGPSATLGQRMVQGGKVAGSNAAFTSTSDDNFWTNKGIQIGTAGAAGFVAPPIMEGVVRGASAAVNRMGDMVRGTRTSMSPQQIETTLRLELQNSGVNWNGLSQQYRQGLVDEVQSALNSGGTIDPAAIRRLADFQRVGAEPLRGQLSRNPAEFAREQNLARAQQGAPIAERIGQQNEAFVSNLPAADQYGVGQRVISSLTARDAPRRAGVNAAYGEARDHLGRAAPMDSAGFSQAANRALDDQMLGAYLPTEVRTILNDVSTGRIPFNVNTAVQIDSTLSAAQRAAGNRTPQALAIGQVRTALNNSNIADNVGQDAKAVFDRARGMAAQRFGNIERTPALGAALDDAVPDRFVEQYAVRGNVNDVAGMMRNLTNDGRQAARQGVIDWIRQRAVNGEGDTARFSQAGFNRALQTIGDRKLELIFAGNRGQLETLRALGRASANAMSPPPASGVNYSNSATTLLDSLDRASSLPILSSILGRPGDIVRAHQATAALSGAPVTPGAPILRPDAVSGAVGPMGILGALAAPQFTTGMLGLR